MNSQSVDKGSSRDQSSATSSPATAAAAEVTSSASQPHSPSLPPPHVYHCSRCHGTVEGPKYSTCTCAVPAVETTDPHTQHPSATTAAAPSQSQQTFWKGMYDPKTMFSAAVNMFQKRKSEPSASPLTTESAAAATVTGPSEVSPLPSQTGKQQAQGQGESDLRSDERIPIRSEAKRVDSDDEVEEEESHETLSTTVSSVFPMVVSQGAEEEKAGQQEPHDEAVAPEGEEPQEPGTGEERGENQEEEEEEQGEML
jgi:hypothetical protein